MTRCGAGLVRRPHQFVLAAAAGSGSARGIGSLGPPPSGSRPSTGCRSAPLSSTGGFSSAGVSGDALATLGSTAGSSPAAAAVVRSGAPSDSDAPVWRGMSADVSALRPNRRPRKPGFSLSAIAFCCLALACSAVGASIAERVMPAEEIVARVLSRDAPRSWWIGKPAGSGVSGPPDRQTLRAWQHGGSGFAPRPAAYGTLAARWTSARRSSERFFGVASIVAPRQLIGRIRQCTLNSITMSSCLGLPKRCLR